MVLDIYLKLLYTMSIIGDFTMQLLRDFKFTKDFNMYDVGEVFEGRYFVPNHFKQLELRVHLVKTHKRKNKNFIIIRLWRCDDPNHSYDTDFYAESERWTPFPTAILLNVSELTWFGDSRIEYYAEVISKDKG